jgi:PAS domain-containing protein
MVIAAIAVVLVAFAFVRAGRYRIGAILYILVTAVFPLAAPFTAFPHGELGVLATALIPILIASIVLDAAWVAGVTVVIIAVAGIEISMASLTLQESDTGSAILLGVGATGVLLIMFRRHQAALEQMRVDEIRLRDETLHGFFETAPVGICITDENGLLVEWNRALGRLTRIEAKDAIGQPVWDVMFRLLPAALRTEQRRAATEHMLRRMLEGGQSADLPSRETELDAGDDAPHWVHVAPFVVKTTRGVIASDPRWWTSPTRSSLPGGSRRASESTGTCSRRPTTASSSPMPAASSSR